jgi:hypothetical protein
MKQSSRRICIHRGQRQWFVISGGESTAHLDPREAIREAEGRANGKRRIQLYWPVPDTILDALVGTTKRKLAVREQAELDELRVSNDGIPLALARAARRPFLAHPLPASRDSNGPDPETNDPGTSVGDVRSCRTAGTEQAAVAS